MKTVIQHIIIACAVALAAVSCSKSLPVQDNEIDFEISMAGVPTKVSGNSFEIGDRIGVWAVECGDMGASMPLQIGGNFINNEPLVLQDNANHWTGMHTLYWSDNACDFYGLYPYTADIISIDEQPFSVALDQNSGSGFENSDLLWAFDGNVQHGETVTMQFRHMLSKLSIVIVKGDNFEGEIPSDIVVHIYNTTTSCKVDLQEGSIEKDPLGAKSTITAKKVDNQHFETVVVPQFIEKKTPLIEVTMGGIAYLLEYSISFRPGYNHTIQLTLNTSPDQEMIEIGIDAGTGGWN